jgi:DNA-binding transcriptional LysR family regulator
MRFNKLDLNLLVALDAMLQTRSITRAAKQLHMSQSAMSNALARLRDHFEDELLVRVGRHLELTQRAATLREAVRDLLLRVETTISAQPQFDPTQSERLFRIAASDYSAIVLIPHLLALAHRAGARVRFQLLPQVGDSALALERGETDLLIIPKTYCSSEHPLEVLFEETFACLVWAGSNLAREGLDLAAYARAGHVVMQPAGADRPAFGNAFLQSCGLERRVEVSTYSFLVEPALVVGTERVATVHSRLARLASGVLPVKQFAPPLDIPVMEQAIQWHKYRTSDPGLIWLLDLVRAAAREMDASATRGEN